MDEMKTAYDERGIPYLVEAEGSEAKHIVELLVAEAQGRLLVLPCKAGDTVYYVGYEECQCSGSYGNHCSYPVETCSYYRVGNCKKQSRLKVTPKKMNSVEHIASCLHMFGKSVFETYEAAEAALTSHA